MNFALQIDEGRGVTFLKSEKNLCLTKIQEFVS